MEHSLVVIEIGSDEVPRAYSDVVASLRGGHNALGISHAALAWMSYGL